MYSSIKETFLIRLNPFIQVYVSNHFNRVLALVMLDASLNPFIQVYVSNQIKAVDYD